LGWYVLMGQTEQVSEAAPASMYWPAGQIWQLVAPNTLLSEPAWHREHEAALAPLK
jgi:hypothetical protein